MSDLKIACPKCNWEPDGRPYWTCSDCQTNWDTFTTAARCPGCGKQYEVTQCVPYAGGCNVSSPHLDWYRNLNDKLREELAKIKEQVLEKMA